MSEQANMAAHYEHEIPEGYEARIEGNKVIFEQKESEDEKIKRTLVEHFKGYYDRYASQYVNVHWKGLEVKKVINYLEKQKAPHYTKRNALFDKCVENCDPAIMKEVSDNVDKMLEKEQKPAEWSEDWREEDIQTRFAFYTYKDDPSTLYLSNVFVEEASRNHGFGTRILRAAEKVAETIGATTISLKVKQNTPANTWYRKNGYGYVAFEDGYDWLEKNLEYMKPNEPEWSEEDEKMRNSIIADYERSNKEWFTAQCSIPWGKKINWLKSLRNKPCAEHCQPTVSDLAIKFMNYLDRNRPEGKMCLSNGECEDINEAFKKNDLDRIMRYVRKYSWKPSEEQMGALRVTLDFMPDTFKPRCTLLTLQNDLEKLM